MYHLLENINMTTQNVIQVEVPNVQGLFICTSFGFDMKQDPHKEHAEPTVSFLVYSEDKQTVVEWEVTYGAITRIEACKEDWVGDNAWESVKPYWLFGFCKGFGNWAQCAVTECGLPMAVAEGNLEHVRDTLFRYL